MHLLPNPVIALVLSAALGILAPSAARAHGSYDERLARASERVAASPQDPDPLIRRTLLRREHRDFAGALADLEAAAKLAPGRADLDALRGRVHLESGQPQRAIAPLERAVAKSPEDSEAQLALARTLVAVGRPLEGAAHYSLAIEHAPVALPGSYLERARALRAAGPEHRDRALQGLDEGIDRLGSVVALANLAIALEVEAGRFDLALERLAVLAALSPRQETWRAWRAEILEQAGRSAEARAEWTRTLAEIDALSPRHRRTPAMTQLATRVRGALDRLEPEPSGAE